MNAEMTDLRRSIDHIFVQKSSPQEQIFPIAEEILNDEN